MIRSRSINYSTKRREWSAGSNISFKSPVMRTDTRGVVHIACSVLAAGPVKAGRADRISFYPRWCTQWFGGKHHASITCPQRNQEFVLIYITTRRLKVVLF